MAIPFSTEIAVGTPADNAATLVDMLSADLGEDLFCISMDCNYAQRGGTALDGPFQIAVAHGDLTAAEIVEALDAELTDPDDIIQKERARRPVRRVGMFPVAASNEVMNAGHEVHTTLRFSVGDGHNLSFAAVNRTGGAITTGMIIEITGVLYGRWQR